MDFFENEILEDIEIVQELKKHPDLKKKGKLIAQYIIEIGTYPNMEPGLLPIYVLGYLAEYVLDLNKKRGISKDVTLDSLKDVNVWLSNYKQQYGKIGLAEFPWLINHYTGRLFRLGRLQFQLTIANPHIPSGDFMIETHIPQGEALNIEECEKSFQLATEFFKRYYPLYSADYFVCDSWLLNPNLAKILDEETNIVRFMRLWTNYKEHIDHSGQAVERVFGFGIKRDEVAEAPEYTRLQRTLKEYLLKGGEINIYEGYYKVNDIRI